MNASLTHIRAGPIFSTQSNSGPDVPVALSSLTVCTTATATRAIFTDARCPARRPDGRTCHRRLMAIPGVVQIETRVVQSDTERSGRGRVLSCGRCSALVEVIEHKAVSG